MMSSKSNGTELNFFFFTLLENPFCKCKVLFLAERRVGDEINCFTKMPVAMANCIKIDLKVPSMFVSD